MNFGHVIKNRQKYLDLLWIMVKSNFKMRYQNSILGVLWVLIKPYSTFLVLYYIWSNFGSGRNIENFALYLLVGIIFYNYFQDLVISGQMALLDRAGIILKVSFPRQIVIFSSLINAFITLLINIFLAVVIAIFSNTGFNIFSFLYFLFLSFVLLILVTGISFFTSILTIRFRDLRNIFDLGLFLLFWASPIFYAPTNAPVDSNTVSLVLLNPMTHLLAQARASFGIIHQIDFFYALQFLAVSLIIFFFGWRTFNKRIRKIAEYF